MSIVELVLIAVGLSMDAFAVSLCKGISVPKVKPRHMLITGAWFGAFQAAMPIAGYFLGGTFAGYIEAFDHWIAFILLCVIGGKMILDAFKPDEEKSELNPFAFSAMLVMAVATSIDALAVGLTFAMLPAVNIWLAIALIGGITFTLSAVGVKAGSIFGSKLKSKAEFIGGLILIAIGIKILIEHLFF